MTRRPTTLRMLLVAIVGLLLVAVAAPSAFAQGFGLKDFSNTLLNRNGTPDTTAGSHPYQMVTTVAFNTTTNERGDAVPDQDLKQVEFELPPGLVGNPTAMAKCTIVQFTTQASESERSSLSGESCPTNSQIGVFEVTQNSAGTAVTHSVGLFNLVAPPGVPAEFGANIVGVPIVFQAAVRSDTDNGLTVRVIDAPQAITILATKVTVWGVPGDPSHDGLRGACLGTEGQEFARGHTSCPNTEGARPFLSLPTACTGEALQDPIHIDSWQEPGALLANGTADLSDPRWQSADASFGPLDGCNQVSFGSTVSAEPTTSAADSPSGLNVDVHVPQEGLTSPLGVATSHVNKAIVTLPEGMTINPSAGAGLSGCSEAAFHSEQLATPPGGGCPESSKIGDVTVHTPLLPDPLPGAVYVAQPYENPFGSLLALYVVVKDPAQGVLLRLSGEVHPDPVTGRLTSTFSDLPQLPFEDFTLSFTQGQTSPLVSPPTCGSYALLAGLSPWSEPLSSLQSSSLFSITSNCPAGGTPPFHPESAAGSYSNTAGAYSPFYLKLTRKDGEQEITGFSSNLPLGLTGNLTGIPFCPEANIEAARSATRTGAQETASPSCPAASEIGHTLVGAGVGGVLAYVPGKVYLAGPYHGDPFSVLSVTSAVVGPFDLGTVVVRFGLRIDPHTAQVSVDSRGSDAIPHIIRGIVAHVRDIRVYIDRPGFTVNPTNCGAQHVESTIVSNLGQSAAASTPFQASNCAALPFKPKLTASTQGKTSKAGGASLKVKIAYPTGASYANVHSVKVDLPKQLPSRLTTLQKACLAKVFETNPAGCPAASIVGHATATTPILPVPLNGPAYFVSHGGEAFPSLIVVLQGYGVTVDLVGTTFISRSGITSSTFKQVPDVPVGSFEITLPEGKFSALAANGNLCKAKLAMPTAIDAQNGAEIKQNTKITVTGCAKTKKAKHKKPGKHKARGKSKQAKQRAGRGSGR